MSSTGSQDPIVPLPRGRSRSRVSPSDVDVDKTLNGSTPQDNGKGPPPDSSSKPQANGKTPATGASNMSETTSRKIKLTFEDEPTGCCAPCRRKDAKPTFVPYQQPPQPCGDRKELQCSYSKNHKEEEEKRKADEQKKPEDKSKDAPPKNHEEEEEKKKADEQKKPEDKSKDAPPKPCGDPKELQCSYSKNHEEEEEKEKPNKQKKPEDKSKDAPPKKKPEDKSKDAPPKPAVQYYKKRGTREIYCGPCTAAELCKNLAAEEDREPEQLRLDLKTLDNIITRKGARRSEVCKMLKEGNFPERAWEILNATENAREELEKEVDANHTGGENEKQDTGEKRNPTSGENGKKETGEKRNPTSGENGKKETGEKRNPTSGENKEKETEEAKDTRKRRERTLEDIDLYTLRVLATAVASQGVKVTGTSCEAAQDMAGTLAKEKYLHQLMGISRRLMKKVPEAEKKQGGATPPKAQKKNTSSEDESPAKKEELDTRVPRQLEAVLVQLFYIARAEQEQKKEKEKEKKEKEKEMKEKEEKGTATKANGGPYTEKKEAEKSSEAQGKEREKGASGGKKIADNIPELAQVVKEVKEKYKGFDEAKIEALALLVISRLTPDETASQSLSPTALMKVVSWILITQDVDDSKNDEFPYGIRFKTEDMMDALYKMAQTDKNKLQIWMAMKDYIDQLYTKKKQGDIPLAHRLLARLEENSHVLNELMEGFPMIGRILQEQQKETALAQGEGGEKSTATKDSKKAKDATQPSTGGKGKTPRKKEQEAAEKSEPEPKYDMQVVEAAIKHDEIAVLQETINVPADLVKPQAQAAKKNEAPPEKEEKEEKPEKPEKSENQEVLHRLMEKAIQENRPDFVRHFIDKGLDMEGFIKDSESKAKKEWDTKDKVKELLPTLCKDSDRSHSMKTLLLYALVSHKHDIAGVFWKFETEKMAAALYAKALLKASRRASDNPYLYSTIKHWEQEWEDRACSILVECQSEDLGRAVQLVQLKSEVWGSASCVDIALQARARKFLTEPSVQMYVDKVWRGHLHFDNFNDAGSKALFVLALFCPPALLALRYKTEKDFSDPAAKDMGAKKTNGNGKDDKEIVASYRRENRRRPLDTAAKFYAAPVVKCWVNAILYIIFLALYSYMILVEFSATLQWAEVAVYVWMFSLIALEIYEIADRKWHATTPTGGRGLSPEVKLYLYNIWNVLDIVSHVGFLVGAVVRAVSLACPTCNCRCLDAARVIYALDLIILCCRFLHIVAASSYLGAKLVIIRRMFKDLVGFVVILLVFVGAYAISSEAILYPNTQLHPKLPYYLLRKAYFNIFGELFLEELEEGGDSCNPCTNDPSLYANYSVPRCPSDYGTYIAPMMLGGYILFTNVLLLNLLIAMFSHTFNRVMDKKRNGYWHYERAKLVNEYVKRPIIPPPFILFWFIYFFARILYKKCCCCRSESQEHDDEEALQGLEDVVKSPEWLLEEQQGLPSLIQETNSTDLKTWGSKKAKEWAWKDESRPAKTEEEDRRLDDLIKKVDYILNHLHQRPDAAQSNWHACFHVLSPYTRVTNCDSHTDGDIHHKRRHSGPRLSTKRAVAKRAGRPSTPFSRQYTSMESRHTQPSGRRGSETARGSHNFMAERGEMQHVGPEFSASAFYHDTSELPMPRIGKMQINSGTE